LKKPWLLTQKGQFAALWLGSLLSLIAILTLIPYALLVASPRQQLPQLDPSNITYCEISVCNDSSPLGLNIRDVTLSENSPKTTIIIEFINQQRWQGEREVWLQFRSDSGNIVEMASGILVLNDKTARVEFSFNGSTAELNTLKWLLGT
jgi:hypothetical protein